MAHRILWFDNDLDFLPPYADALRDEGHRVTAVGTLADADRELAASRYDLLILDVMIPTHSEVEEQQYPPEATNKGTETGLLYYRTWRDRLTKAGTAVLILTVRPDSNIRQMFKDAGAPAAAISTKLDLRNVNDFITKVEQVLNPTASVHVRGSRKP